MDEVPVPLAVRNGIDGFITSVSELAWHTYSLRTNDLSHAHRMFVHEAAKRYANIRLRDFGRPLRFLRQMAGAPPVQLGTVGFRSDLVDDINPARHYTALLFVGFYLPTWLAILVLYVWEMAGFVRYGGHWSWPDIRSGVVGVHHGRLVRRYGGVVLPSLIASQLAEIQDD